jgi:hypothetical protein
MSVVEMLLQLCDGCDHLFHDRDWAEDHAGHCFIVPPQVGKHPLVGRQREAAANG